MNKLIFFTCVCISLFLAACGDNSNSVEPPLEESSSSIVKSSSSTTAKKPSSSSSAKSSSNKKVSSSSFMPGMVDPSTVVIDSMTDSRDGQTYKTTTIGSQTWMAKNLNFETADSYCYNDSTKYCSKYGRFYSWAAAKTACPTSWHLPTKAEFETLFTAVGGSSIAGKMLKSSTDGWFRNGEGTDAYSFSAFPAGRRFDYRYFFFELFNAFFWSSTEFDSDYAYYLSLSCDNDEAYLLHGQRKAYGHSVRCVKDE